MNCLIDFGNSRCKWTIIDIDQPIQAQTISYTSANSLKRINEVLTAIPFQKCHEIHIASVLGNEFEQQFISALRDVTSIEPVFHVAQKNNHGVVLSYSDPLTYGVDRYAAIIAAHHSGSESKIIVDCGTAITVDVLDEKGHHLGGLIFPGVRLMRSLLAENAAMIPALDSDVDIQLLNHSTQDALNSGSVLSLKYGLHTIIHELKQRIGETAQVYVTGGEIDLLGLMDHDYIYRPNLVLEGLQFMLD